MHGARQTVLLFLVRIAVPLIKDLTGSSTAFGIDYLLHRERAQATIVPRQNKSWPTPWRGKDYGNQASVGGKQQATATDGRLTTD
jgi:hypothetical protein